jgi:GH24 family phage-related lysozyme (muramidase)
MPKPSSQSIQQNRELAPVSTFQNENVVAHPVDTYVAPAPNSAMRLADALKGLQPGLNKYLDAQQAEHNQAQALQGAKARMAQADPDPVLTPEQDPYFQQGYMSMHGKLAGESSKLDLMAAYDQHKNDPQFNVDSFVQQHMANDLAGMTDTDALKAYLPELHSAQETLKADFLKMHTEQVRENVAEMGTADARNLNEAAYLTGGVSQEAYQAYIAQQATMGTTRPEASTMFLDAARQFGDQGYPEVYNVFLKPDAGGIAPIDNEKLAPRIREAIQHATAERDRRLKVAAAQGDLAAWASYETRVKHEDPTLSPQEVLADPRLKPEEKKKFITDSLEIQHKSEIKQRALVDIMGGTARFGSLPDNERSAYQQTFDDHGNSLLAQVGTGQKTLDAALGEIATLSARNGIEFQPLKRLLSTIDTEVPTDKTGSVPPAFTKAAEYYQTLKAVNPALAISYSSDGSRAMLDAYNRAVQNDHASPADAFAKARKFADPEVRKSAVEFVANNHKVITDAVTSEMGKVTGTGLFGVGKDTTRNIEQIKQWVLGDLSANPSAVYLDKTEAIKASIEKFKGLNVPDGLGHYVFTGGNAGSNFAPATKFYLESFKLSQDAKYGAGYSAKQGDTFLVHVGNSQYQVFDQLGPVADAAPISQKDLVGKYEQATSKATQQQLQLRADLLGAVADPKKMGATPEEQLQYLDTNASKIVDLHRSGALSQAAYNSLTGLRASLHADTWLTKLKTQATIGGSQLSQGMQQDQTQPVTLAAPIVNPGGSNPDSLALAKRYQGSDPAFALTAAVEGLKLNVYGDPANGRNIGFGYNIDHRGEAQARKDFRRAGIPDTVTEGLLNKDPAVAGRVSISPDQAVRLYSIIKPEYEKVAKGAVESVTGLPWDGLRDHQKAALTYLAYATGDVKQYKKVLSAMQAGNMDQAASEMTLRYTDGKTGDRKTATRAVELTRSMFLNPGRFDAILNHITQGAPGGYVQHTFGAGNSFSFN